MSRHPTGRRRDLGGLIPGLILIAVGLAFLLERFDVISIGYIWRLWPLVLIIIGFTHLLRPEGGRRSIFLLLLGVWLQINVLELWGLDFGDSWPLLIMFIGASFVFDALVSGNPRRQWGSAGGAPASGPSPPGAGASSEDGPRAASDAGADAWQPPRSGEGR